MSEDFSGKVVLLTGAASGIGLATALAIATGGASVGLADCDEEAVHTAAALFGVDELARPIRCDVTSKDDVIATVDRTVAVYDGTRETAQVQQRGVFPTARVNARHEQDIGVGLPTDSG